MRFTRIVSTVALFAAAAGSAHAGGFSRGSADTDILYEDGNFNFRAGAAIVVPTQKFKTGPGGTTSGGVVGTDYLGTYAIPSAGIKFRISDNLSCAGTFTDAYGADSVYDSPYGITSKLSEQFTVSEFGATCAVFFDLGKGRLSVLGGGFVEKFNYSLSSLPTLPGVGAIPLNVGLDSNAYGWRAGLGYEIPDIAFRAQLMYRSGTTHEADGTGSLAGVIPLVTTGRGQLPQSVELKLRSGIAPGWLAFGSVKWTDWSVNETLDLSISGVPGIGTIDSLNQYYWRDGWTVTGGIGHAFNDNVSGLVSLQWDRGVATGFDFRTDKWLLAGGVSMKDAIGGELRLGGGFSYLTSASVDDPTAADFGASVDSGWAGIVSANYTLKW